MVLRPMTMKPLARSRAMATASATAGAASCSTLDPAVVVSPARSKRSFTPKGMPAKGEGALPARRCASARSASASASSDLTEMKARAPSPAGSAIRARDSSTSARAEVRPVARAVVKPASVARVMPPAPVIVPLATIGPFASRSILRRGARAMLHASAACSIGRSCPVRAPFPFLSQPPGCRARSDASFLAAPEGRPGICLGSPGDMTRPKPAKPGKRHSP